MEKQTPFGEKQLCATVAKSVRGVRGVNNRMDVDLNKARTDSDIKADVQKALEWDPHVDHSLIDVDVKDGEVKLIGIVGSAAEKRVAMLDACVLGSKTVDIAGLEVKRWARDKDLRKNKYIERSDEAVRKAVEDALLYDPRTSSFNVRAEVVDGTVFLRGKVDNLKAKRAAAMDARNTLGVRGVVNNLKVRPRTILSDRKIEDQIINTFIRDPYVESYQVAVDVTGGVAKLKGEVDTYFEKSRAEDLASRVNGVLIVTNNITVDKGYAPYIYDPYVDEVYPYEYEWYHPAPRYPIKSDVKLKSDIKSELFWSPFVDADEVNVKVDVGVATLSGTVDSWMEYDAAEGNAYQAGAVYVDNELKVASSD